MIKQRKHILLTVWLLLVLMLPGWWFGSVWYLDWYENTTPAAPIPDGARLLARSPDDHHYWSSIARYWYTAKYASPWPTTRVQAFYDQYGRNASPFGRYYVEVLPPVFNSPYGTGSTHRVSTVRRDPFDPPGETLILIEVGWIPIDETNTLVGLFCGFPVLWLSSLLVLITITRRQIQNSETLQE
jgi:hypothetical protein